MYEYNSIFVNQTKMICGDRDKSNAVPYGIIDWVSIWETLLECLTYSII